MGLSADDLVEIDALLGASDAGAEVVASVRVRFPGLPVTRADPSDLDTEMPFRQYYRFDLFLVDGSNHCWRLTAAPEQASGLVIVARRGTL
jgi:hypothetical protein